MYLNAWGYGRPWGGYGGFYPRGYLGAGIGYPYGGYYGFPGCYGYGCGYYGYPYVSGGLL